MFPRKMQGFLYFRPQCLAGKYCLNPYNTDNCLLMEVCDRVMNGEFVYPEDTPVIRIGYSNSTEFTGREFDIIRELAQGRKYEEIAADLDITLNTVKYHIKNILQKTGYQNTLQLVAEVVAKRLILPPY